MLGNVSSAMLVRVNDEAQQVLAQWPDANSSGEQLHPTLSQTLHKQRLHIERLDEQHYRVGHPLFINNTLWGLVLVELEVAGKNGLADVVRGLKWGQFWLQFLLRQLREPAPSAAPAAAEKMVVADTQQGALLQLSATLLKENSLPEMAISLVNVLAAHLGAARVSLGLLHEHKLQLEAVSFSAHFDSRTQSLQAVTEAMYEAIEQGLSLSYGVTEPASENTQGAITRAHQQLLQSQQRQWVTSFPIRKGDLLLGALSIELDSAQGLSAEQQLFVQATLQFAGAIIALRQNAEAGFTRLLARALGSRLQRWFGAEAWRGRVLGALAILLLVALFVPVPWRVSADASLQTTEKYLVVSPQDGYLGRVVARPGDSVKSSALLASLNDEDLLLERRKLASQVQRYRQAYDSALANSDRVEAAIANAQMDQASIQLRLVEQQLQRTQLVAPIDGIIVSDDISQNQGAPVKQGDVLFELAAANDFVVHMFVDERDIAALELGQQGQVKFTSLPNSIFAVRVKNLTPISEVREGRNYFRVEVELLADEATARVANLLRPGMTGTGKVHVGKRALGWIWFHDVWHWLRLSLW
jgi:hypothetical protein